MAYVSQKQHSNTPISKNNERQIKLIFIGHKLI